MRFRAPANVFLHRAQLIFMLATLIPTVLMTVVGVLLLVVGGSKSIALVAGILVLCLGVSSLTGYILGTIFVTRGATLTSLQNDFLSAVSHELRTPLTSMRMFIDTLREERVTDPVEKQRCLTVVHQEMNRLDALVAKLFELSKIEAGRHAFERRPVAIGDVVEEALRAFDAITFGNPVDLEVKVEPGLVVNGDRSALAQAITNLLTNAWKYTPPSGRKITLEARSAGDKQVIILVSDNGSGIPKEEQKRIFEKFERGKAAQGGGTTGSGLGLAIVRSIVRAHRGKVELRSEPDHGSQFRIVLKRCPA